MSVTQPIDWASVRRILVIRLRSIGDTVLATPTLHALRRALPGAAIDILLEDWVAPLLEGHADIDSIISTGRGSWDRIKTALNLRRRRYDVVINLHGGTTATFFARATGARHRVGYANYQYPFLYSQLLSSSADFWEREFTHSAEQQLALAGFIGIPVGDAPDSRLTVTNEARQDVSQRLRGIVDPADLLALIHPAAAFPTKQWAASNFGRVVDHVARLGFKCVAVGSPAERTALEAVKAAATEPVTLLDDLTLPQLTALAERASIFVGNDSGIAHIAAAVGTPPVVIFGSSNRNHWRPWTRGANEVVFVPFDCQPCAGYVCEVYGEPRCILHVDAGPVMAAIDRIVERDEAAK